MPLQLEPRRSRSIANRAKSPGPQDRSVTATIGACRSETPAPQITNDRIGGREPIGDSPLRGVAPVDTYEIARKREEFEEVHTLRGCVRLRLRDRGHPDSVGGWVWPPHTSLPVQGASGAAQRDASVSVLTPGTAPRHFGRPAVNSGGIASSPGECGPSTRQEMVGGNESASNGPPTLTSPGRPLRRAGPRPGSSRRPRALGHASNGPAARTPRRSAASGPEIPLFHVCSTRSDFDPDCASTLSQKQPLTWSVGGGT